MRRGYTLIEIIITIAITGILSVGMFKAFEAITLRSEKAKILTTLSIDSQSALDQLSLLLYDRAPILLQECNSTGCSSLDADINATILQWYGTASESYQAGDYSGFVDMAASDKSTKTLSTPNTSIDTVIETERQKWNNPSFDATYLALTFAGAFEDGDSAEVNLSSSQNNNNDIVLSGTMPSRIYEKYYLVDSAYAVTRGENVDQTKNSIINLRKDFNVTDLVFNNTLLLFYNYRPWKSPTETMYDGNVSILATNVNGFAAHQINGTIRLGIDMNQTVGRDITKTVRLSKQKVVF